MSTLNVEIFETLSDLQEFATTEGDVTDSSTERIFHHDGQWYLLYWTT